MVEPLHLETVLTSPKFFGLTTATPVQRAFCRVAEGLPLSELAACADVREAVGGEEALALLAPGGERPRELDVLAAIRSGKSLLVAAHAFWTSQTARLDHIRPGEVPRYSILSVNVRSADATFAHLVGTMTSNALLRSLLVGDPADSSLYIRHPSGRVVEVAVAAGARAGANLVSVWLLGAAFEEYPRQAGEAGGAVVNYDQQLQAAAGRVVEGGQLLSVGSPWAPFGPAHERFSTSFGRPSADRVVVKAPGPAMNPVWWTPARCEALRRSNPTAYVTDVLAGFANPSSAFIPQSDVRAAVRREGPAVLPPTQGVTYSATMDPATRGNAWALVLLARRVDREGVDRFEVVLARQWQGSSIAPLSPWAVMQEIARVLAPYGVTQVATDQAAADAIKDIGVRVGLSVVIGTIVAGNAPEPLPGQAPTVRPGIVHRNDMFETMAGIFATGAIGIPDDRALIGDLLSIRRVTTRTGVTYDLPTSADGRHCDLAAALALGLARYPTTEQARSSAALARRMQTPTVLDYLFGAERQGPRGALADRLYDEEQARAGWEASRASHRRGLDEWSALLKRTGSPAYVPPTEPPSEE